MLNNKHFIINIFSQIPFVLYWLKHYLCVIIINQIIKHNIMTNSTIKLDRSFLAPIAIISIVLLAILAFWLNYSGALMSNACNF